ncbi:unnamed protein product [Rotaria sordida]|uniref:Uncharacterized protein n=1 Tax=Rotaria sordida TaxID=392033 RepID=A0A819ZA38_9BILA|nr:unnamed protein product [Rotaria sordida]
MICQTADQAHSSAANAFPNHTTRLFDRLIEFISDSLNNYDFINYSTPEIFMILLHLLQSLPQPLISYEIQDKMFLNTKEYFLRQDDMTKAVSIIVERLKTKERNLFFRFLILLKKCWPTKEQIQKSNEEYGNIFNIAIDILALSILHEHLDRNQRHAFILACLNEEKKN